MALSLRKSSTREIPSSLSYSINHEATATMGDYNIRHSFDDPLDWQEDDENFEQFDFESDEDVDLESGLIHLASLGRVDPDDLLDAIDEITDKYLTPVEGDLIWLMRKGRRPVEISRILGIPECEVVRLRRNCFRKISVVYTLDYHRDKKRFLDYTIKLLNLTEKQSRIFTMFLDYYGLRPIAEVIGTRPSNIHRSLESIRSRLDQELPKDHEFRPYMDVFTNMKYLNLSRSHA